MEIAKIKPQYNRRQKGIRATAYITKVAFLATLSFVLYTYLRFPIFPIPPFNVLEMDFSAVPSLLGGFALGPVAAVIIECIKVGIKMAAQGSATGYVGDLSNLIVSLAFVMPATIYYRFNKTRKGALIGMIIGVAANALVASLSNYFIIVPMYAKLFSPALMEVRTLFAFGYGLAFNLIKTVCTCIIVFFLYKRLSKVLHLGIKPNSKRIPKKQLTLENGKSVLTHSASETAEAARLLAATLRGGEVILLSGELGAGKTTFTKGLAEGLGIKSTVQSPTFTIIKEYTGEKFKLYHIDMYRISDESELSELGLEDCFADNAVTVIEWNRMPDIPKDKIIKISIKRLGDDDRALTAEGIIEK